MARGLRFGANVDQSAVMEAIRLHQAGRQAEAREMCRALLSREPGNGEAHYVLGLAAQALGQADEAGECFVRAVELRPELAEAIDGGRLGHDTPHWLPPLTAEGTVGAAFGLIHARLCDPQADGSLAESLNPLMALIVLPYRGHVTAGRELVGLP